MTEFQVLGSPHELRFDGQGNLPGIEWY
jgi:hypothetical protein